jgi:hypothetical protein
MLTAQELIDGARLRHWSFADTVLGDGAAVLYLNQRIRTLLLRYRSALRALVNATIETAAVVSGSLVGIDSSGVPYYLDTVGEGYAVHLDGSVPYIDATEAPISLDPFGSSGSTPGFPLPPDAIALFSVSVLYQDGSSGDVDVVDEALRNQGPPGHNPAAFLSGNRIVAIRPSQPGGQDIWTSVTAVQVSYLPLASVTALITPIALPVPIAEVLIADLCELFAMQSQKCPKPDRAEFIAAARRAEQELDLSALDIVGDMQVSSVIFEG